MIKSTLLLIFIQFFAWSSDLYLFDQDGSFNSDFATSIISGELLDGEYIHLEDHSLAYKGVLGSGNTTLILKVIDQQTGKEMALRLPHGNQELGFTIDKSRDHINYTIDGYEELRSAHLSIPNLYAYTRDSYILAEVIQHDFTLRTFLARNENEPQQSKEKMTSSLIDFFKESSIFQAIGDFHFDQLVYSRDKNKWYLLDWGPSHQKATSASSSKIFKGFHFISNNYALNEDGSYRYEIDANGNRSKVFRNTSPYENELYRILEKEVKAHRQEIFSQQNQPNPRNNCHRTVSHIYNSN